MAAKHLAGHFTLQALDFHLHAEVGNYQAGLFRAEVAALQCFHCPRFTLGGAGRALTLNLFDPPVLAAVELAFGHGASG